MFTYMKMHYITSNVWNDDKIHWLLNHPFPCLSVHSPLQVLWENIPSFCKPHQTLADTHRGTTLQVFYFSSVWSLIFLKGSLRSQMLSLMYFHLSACLFCYSPHFMLGWINFWPNFTYITMSPISSTHCGINILFWEKKDSGIRLEMAIARCPVLRYQIDASLAATGEKTK